MSKELTPEEFYKDTYGEDPPKIFANPTVLNVFDFAKAYSNRILKQEREKQRERHQQAINLLQATKNGIEWTIESLPENMDKSDYEHYDNILAFFKQQSNG